MPELPEVEALAAFLRERAVGHVLARADLAAVQAIKTFDPPLSALGGLEITGAGRHGKFLDLDVSGVHLVVHLARAGWLHWRTNLPAAPPKPGKGPLALRVHLDDGATDPSASGGSTDLSASGGVGFDLTEQGTRKGLAVYVVRSPAEVPGIARLGPDALAVDRETFARLMAGRSGQLKGALTDQTLVAGIGNAYSDEILHAARLSPFKMADKLTDDELVRLFDAVRTTLTGALERQVGQQAATMKGEKRSGLRVHARTGLPCPVCGDTVREVSFADTSLQYCPTCQTGGKPLADRRMSKLLR
ncbi:Fpg/Nei family DNA glycosylase [Blastococcus saxobsidens]|uniref:DNA-(Apurinic or apyrimidinic site) lyase Formamidopyrimidine-DNA glycosylase n=1 Tax=Blastococcus saxobsidens (strain DD2) TaxID=1146883 RepID=H6RL39_BLASD|nr:DNA-formamidopyrimidine glycosylase family protein [Blastococcus saxobsidens]CCG01169.1 DNA-(Apurinic or apyrimidinic site) lyase; Formamidopyrimidine-DNA glycosylase [Blastococcus saxobsidens DD2]